MKNLDFFVRPTSTLGGASLSDEKASIAELVEKISVDIRAVEMARIAEPAAPDEPRHLDSAQSVESARLNAQKLVAYLTVASHLPAGVDEKIRSLGDSLLNRIDELQTRGVDAKTMVSVQSSLTQFTSAMQALDPSGNPASPSPSADPSLGVTPEVVCRNLPPDVQKWFVTQDVDCTSLPPEALMNVARCGVMNKVYDATSNKCATVDGVVDSDPPLGSKPPPPAVTPDSTDDEPGDDSVSPWLIGGLVLAATAGAFWFLQRPNKKSTKTPKKATVK